jgi:hypothetical protein
VKPFPAKPTDERVRCIFTSDFTPFIPGSEQYLNLPALTKGVEYPVFETEFGKVITDDFGRRVYIDHIRHMVEDIPKEEK